MSIRSEFPDVPIANCPIYETVLKAIHKHSIQHPEKAAIIDADDPNISITFGQLYTESHSIAAFLDRHHFGYGDIAAVVIPNCWQYASFYLGATMVGGAVTGASFHFTDYELEKQFSDASVKIVLTTDEGVDRVRRAAIIIVLRQSVDQPRYKDCFDWHQDVIQMPANNERAHIQHNLRSDLAVLPYSSGTTGPPKGVMHTHVTLGTMIDTFIFHFANYVFPYVDAQWNMEKEAQLIFLPFYHNYGFHLIMFGLITGSTSIVMRRFQLRNYFAAIEKYKIRWLALVPPLLVHFAKSPLVDEFNLSSVELILCGAAAVGRDLTEKVKHRLPNLRFLTQAYGMTEMCYACHFPRLDRPIVDGSIGSIMSNYEQRIVDIDSGQDCETNKPGELWMRGPTIMIGYLNRPKATADTIDNNGWLHTGDIAYMDSSGNTFIVERQKELIKVRGLQVSPAELEDLLLSHPDVRDAAVIGIADEMSGELPRAYIVRANDRLTEIDVDRFVNEKVSHYKHLKGGIRFIDEIPKSPSGKIYRRFLRDRAANEDATKKIIEEKSKI